MLKNTKKILFWIVADRKEKWHNIRGRYLRQLKEIQPSGSGTKPKKNYYLNEYLNFLEPFTTSRIQTGNLTKNQEPIPDAKTSDWCWSVWRWRTTT